MPNFPKKLTFGREVPLVKKSIRSEQNQLDAGFFKQSSYTTAIAYAQEHSSLEGVGKIRGKIEEAFRESKKSFDECLGEINPRLKQDYDSYLAEQKRADLFSNLWRIALLVAVVALLGSFSTPPLASVFGIALVALIVLAVCANVFQGKAKKARATFDKSLSDGRSSAATIQVRFDNAMKKYYEEIDGIFLASLDSTERQILLLRRENAASEERERKRDEQMMNLQAQNQALQEKIAEQQSAILDIEKERERRYQESRR